MNDHSKAGQHAGNDHELGNRRDRLGVALHEVAIPPGLAERLLAQLEIAAGTNPVTCEAPSVAPATSDLPVASPSTQHGWSRRVWLTTAGASLLALAASVVLIVGFWHSNPDQASTEDLLEAARNSFELPPATEGQLLGKRAAPADYPVGPFVIAGNATRWRNVNNLLGRSGVAYDLLAADHTLATLYVVHLGGRPHLSLAAIQPPQQPQTTGGYSCGAWASGDLLYVLVVAGNEEKYHGFLRRLGPMS